MTIKFEGTKYQVGFCDYLNVKYHQSKLMIKRQKRRLKLLFRKEDAMLYGIISICWFAFGVAMLIAGQYHVATPTKSYRISDVLWDIKGSYFSSVILAFVISAFGRINSYRNKIDAQHDIYVTAMSDFEGIITRFVEEDQYCYFALYCDKCLEDTIRFVSTNYPPKIRMTDIHRLNLTVVRDRLVRVEQEFIKGNIVRYKKDNWHLFSSLDEARQLIDKMQLDDGLLIVEVCDLTRVLIQIVDALREPWRVDISAKIHILRILNNYPDNNISEHFYYKMLLSGHDFRTVKEPIIVKVRRKG